MSLTKRERFAIFVERLLQAPAAGSAKEAYLLLGSTLNAVENEFTSIPYDPTQWANDGRMYPPLADSARDVPGRGDLIRYRSRAHNTYIAANGAICIESLPGGELVLNKPGRNGEKVEMP